MKTDTPSLILYFTACFLCVLFCGLDINEWVIYPKAVIVPAIFYYYYINNNYKISLDKVAVFLLAFIADVYILLEFDSSFLVSICCVVLFYLIILRYVIMDFLTSKIKKRDALPIAIVLVFITYLLIMVMRLDFKNEQKFFYLFLFYGLILAVMGKLSILNYIAKGNRQTISGILMWICFMMSDIFYMLYHFYLPFYLFELINISTQVLSYFFMVRYFLRTDRAVNS
jgi:YhhN-like protein